MFESFLFILPLFSLNVCVCVWDTSLYTREMCVCVCVESVEMLVQLYKCSFPPRQCQRISFCLTLSLTEQHRVRLKYVCPTSSIYTLLYMKFMLCQCGSQNVVLSSSHRALKCILVGVGGQIVSWWNRCADVPQIHTRIECDHITQHE